MKKQMKVETIAEFLARGGEIKKYPMAEHNDESHTIPINPPNLERWSLSDGEIFFGEGRMKLLKDSKVKTKAKAKKPTNITIQDVDMSKIPTFLKEKLNLAE